MEVLSFKKSLKRIDLISKKIYYVKFGSVKKNNYKFKDIKIEKDLDYIYEFQREKKTTKFSLILFILTIFIFFITLNISNNNINHFVLPLTFVFFFISAMMLITNNKILKLKNIPVNGCLNKDKIEKYYKDIYDVFGLEERQKVYKYEFYIYKNINFFIDIKSDYKCIKNINDFKIFLKKIKEKIDYIEDTNINSIYIGETNVLILPKNDKKIDKKCPNLYIYNSSDIEIEKNIRILEEEKRDFLNIETTLKTELIYI